MAYRHKLSCRLALLRDALTVSLSVAAAATCERPAPVTGLTSPVVQIIVVPESLGLDPTQQNKFLAYSRSASGDSSAVAVAWSASGGTITPDGMFTADTVSGDFLVIAASSPLKLSGASKVHIRGRRPVASVTVSPAAPSMQAGQTVQLSATPKDAGGAALTGRVVTWASSATGVATVSGSGLVTGGAAGSATITATSEGQSGTAGVTVSIVPVASVTVTPATASISTGQTVQLTGTPKDASGTALTGRVVTWATSNAGVATVSGSGLVTGVAAGSATITATSEGKNGTAALTVTAVVTNPGTVADLAVAGVTDSSVTLSFTEVTDGTGQPASYDIRWAVGAIAWSSAADVTRGSCTVPVVGSTIGAKRSCTVLGLASVTGYQFQLIAFRGTLNVNAVFGGLSNVVSGTTTGTPVPVASVTVSPAPASVPVGQTVQLTATPRDANNNPLLGRVVTWVSSNTLVATVNGSGLVIGVATGSATITATSEGVTGTAVITVTVPPPPPPAGTCPNQPGGLTTLTDFDFNAVLPVGTAMPVGTSGWAINNDLGWATRVVDASSPGTNTAVGQWRYPGGDSRIAGGAPATMYRNVGAPREVFICVWFKISNPFYLPSSGMSKLFFQFFQSNQMFWYFDGRNPGDHHTLWLRMETGEAGNRAPNVSDVNLTWGVWHKFEGYLKYGTSPTTNSIVRVWIDGTLVEDYNNVTFMNDAGFGEWQFSPTWGGSLPGESPPADCFLWYDDIHISRP